MGTGAGMPRMRRIGAILGKPRSRPSHASRQPRRAFSITPMKKSFATLALLGLGLLFTVQAKAQGTAGKVTKVDRAQQKITLRHEAIKNLDMPPMSMVFRVKDPAMLDAVKEGDSVHFEAEKINGQYVVTRIGK